MRLLSHHFRALALGLLCLAAACAPARAGGVPIPDPPPVELALPPPSSNDGRLGYTASYMLANAYVMIEHGNYFQAQNFIERALRERPRDPKLLRVAAHVTRHLEYWPNLNAHLGPLVELEPDARDALAWRGYVRFLIRDGAGSQTDLETLLAGNPPPAVKAWAESLLPAVRELNLGFATAAAEEWEALRRREAEAENRDDPEAMARFYDDLAKEPGMELYALTGRGFMFLRHGRLEEAKAALARALADDRLDAKNRAEVENALTQIRRIEDDARERREVENRVAQLEKADDLGALDKYYTELAERDTFRTFALAARGFVRLRQGRADEARKDLDAVLHSPDLGARNRIDVAAAIERIDKDKAAEAELNRIRADVARMETDGDGAGLERLYTELAERDGFREYALSSRGFLRMGQRRFDEAREDFAKALESGGLADSARADIETAVRRMDADREIAAAWERVGQDIEKLEGAGDVAGLDRYYTQLTERDAFRDYAFAARGFILMSQGRLDEARADFARALGGRALPKETKDDIAAAVSRMDNDPGAISDWDRVKREIGELKAGGDTAALERYYAELLRQDRYRGFAMSSRGFLHLERGELAEAEALFEQALDCGDLDPETCAAVEAALQRARTSRRLSVAWEAVRAKVKELEAAGRNDTLEKLYTALADRKPFRVFALTSRGYLRLGAGRTEEAETDLGLALALPELEEADRKNIMATLSEIASGRLKAEQWEEARKLATRLEEEDDLEGVEAVLNGVLDDQPDNMYAVAMRGVNRISLGMIDEGTDDLALAIEAREIDAEYRKMLEELLEKVDESVAADLTPDSPRVAHYFAKANELLAEKDFDGANDMMVNAYRLRMSPSQNAVYLFYLAESLWAKKEYSKAYTLYKDAIEQLIDTHRLSDAKWRMSEYHQKKGERAKAVALARESVAAAPDLPWRKIQAAYLFYRYKMNEEAILYFEQVIDDDKLKFEEIAFFQDLGTAYLRLGNRERFRHYVQLHIDRSYLKVESPEVEIPKDVNALFGARQYNTTTPKRLRGYAYLFGSRFDNGDYLMQSLNEINLRLSTFNTVPVEAYFQTVGALASSFSGTYYNTWGGGYEAYSGKSDFGDTFKVVLGLRVTPVAGWSLALDRVFKIGRETDNDVRLRLGYFWAHGGEWEPCRDNWNYAMLYTDAVYSLEHSEFTFFGEARAGRSFKLDRLADKLVVTPFVGATLTGGGKAVPKSERWAGEAGPGLSVKKWVREDKYKAPQASWECIVQYRFGLTRNRRDVLSCTLSHAF